MPSLCACCIADHRITRPPDVTDDVHFIGTRKSVILLDGIQDYHLTHHVTAADKTTGGFVLLYKQVECFVST
jgi:hypothetical protein